MEVHAFKVSISNQDLNDLMRKYLPANVPVEELVLEVDVEGLVIRGVYPLFINVHFETVWVLGTDQGYVTARFDRFKAMGVPANIFKSAIVKMIEDVAQAEHWIRVQGETLWMDIDACISKYAFNARTNIKTIACEPGRILIEGENP